MNCFGMDKCARISARLMCDTHNNKMIVESAQMLSTAHHELGSDVTGLYKPTHVNHPMNVWVRSDRSHYLWLLNHLDELLLERQHRFPNKARHKTGGILSSLVIIPTDIPVGNRQDMPQCMPDEFKHDDFTVAYKRYYSSKLLDWMTRDGKRKIVPKWTLRGIPLFIKCFLDSEGIDYVDNI